MALGSGGKHLVREALTWIGVMVAGAGVAYYFDDVLAAFQTSTEVIHQVVEESLTEREPARDGFERTVRLKAGRNGHFAVRAYLNGRPVALMADTGATVVALTHEDASRIGFSPGTLDYTARTRTANGIARVAPITIDRVRVGDIMVRNVRGLVAEPGKLAVSLLGMSFLGKLTRFEMRGRELVLIQ